MGLSDDLKMQWRTGGMLLKLIFINVGVFLAINLIGVLFFLMESQLEIVRYLGVPADIISFIKKPWTMITYMFTHEGFWHLFWNMVILYFLGRIFLDLLGEKRMLGLYVLGGIAGFIMYTIAYNIFPVFSEQVQASWMIGASASVMAIVFGVAAYSPNYQLSLFLPQFVVKLWWIAAFYLITDIIGIQGSNSGGALAHIGGGLFGVLFANQLKKGNDIASGLGSWILSIGKPRERKAKMRVEKRPKAKSATNKASQSNNEMQAKVDVILDKISKSGYDSLSQAERDLLFRASKDD